MKRLSYERAVLLLTAAFFVLSAAAFAWSRRGTQGWRVTAQRAPAPAQTPAQSGDGRPDSLLDGEVIDLNTASASDLARLPGIGKKRAQAIIERRERGAFRSVEELAGIEGIGQGILRDIRPYVRAGAGETP